MEMSFLKKLGQVLLSISAAAIGIGPIVAPLFGGGGNKIANQVGIAANDLTLIGSVIVQIETALQGKAGAEKLAAAIALVGPIIKTSQLVSGKKIANAALLQQGIDEVTQGVVDVLNSLHSDSVSTEVKT